MRKLVIFLLGLCALLYVAKRYMDGQSAQPGEPTQAKRRLDDMRDKARKIEADDARRADEILKGSEGK